MILGWIGVALLLLGYAYPERLFRFHLVACVWLALYAIHRDDMVYLTVQAIVAGAIAVALVREKGVR